MKALENQEGSFGLRASQATDATVQDARVLIPVFTRLPAWIKDGRLNNHIVNVIGQEEFDRIKTKVTKKLKMNLNRCESLLDNLIMAKFPESITQKKS